ncbi:protein of unknown function [Taphrina deformans PYCC 5710]|uniref:F-box domain-containing protein n=1 Tax=Taphrina deformans (strain PYCC 5710 / ATCC 11124 / CBS 356.35 / IMI 108563 / JCM 9778 / NBRC 8474) TaxID=1097556 RepID=R4XDU9_TAPDE|nr:protein of unknown function [Taphrina deformans PYCC 5710]|eukprot:CCG84046.1 protein of unknown function [Taphrina deformans PYCC 5710]
MNFEDLPTELLLEILSILDHKSLTALAQTSKHFLAYASDDLIWRDLHGRTFSHSRDSVTDEKWMEDYASRIGTLREFIVRGTNDYQARIMRSFFSDMAIENGTILAATIEESDISLKDLLVEAQGYALANVQRLLPGTSISSISGFLGRNRERLQSDPRSEVHLIRMLLSRHTGFEMGVANVELFLKCAHLIIYNSVDHPLYFFPPAVHDASDQQQRYNLRKTEHNSQTAEQLQGPVINWGVVETIHSLIKLYRDRMGEAIPRFVKSEDDYEAEVPIVPAMFDADLSGNWKGLYGYLDFRELEVLDFSRAFSPDFFDGLQRLKIGPEESFDTSAHPLDHGEMDERRGDLNEMGDISPSLESEVYLSDDEMEEDLLTDEAKKDQIQERYRFIADGASLHGHFHIHGSTFHIPSMEAGFKIVHFDAMYNQDGLMPWIMEGVHVPSIGIVRRWRDRTEAPGDGVEGPYVLWRNRQADLQDQDATIRQAKADRHNKSDMEEPKLAQVRHLSRASHDLSYIIIEELQSLASRLEKQAS